MDNAKKRATIILAAIIITLIVLGAGQYLWQRYAVDQPLAKAIQSIDGVETFSLDNKNKVNDTVRLTISLSHVQNLQKTYQAVTDGATSILGSKHINITIHDNRSPELEQFYYDIHYYVQEGIATGNYSSMAEKIQQRASANGIKAQVYVDAVNVYLSFANGNADMYVVVPRQANPEVK